LPTPSRRWRTTVPNPTHDAIVRAARELGIDPATALAFAERESAFNPTARSSKTIRGLYQMRGDLRGRYGVGDSDDPYEQTLGWGRFAGDLRKEMSGRLGRDPSDSELYLGHHFGGRRGARMLGMDPETSVADVFTPYELSINPHIRKAGTVGTLNTSTMADIDRRRSKYGGAATEAPDFSSFGDLAPEQPATRTARAPSSAAMDFSSFGDLVAEQPAARPSRAPTMAAGKPDFSEFGTLVS
jgi:hypothetical protein